jgi:hypothetical protein
VSVDVITFAKVVEKGRAEPGSRLKNWKTLASEIYDFLLDANGKLWVLDDEKRDGELAKGSNTEKAALTNLFNGIPTGERRALQVAKQKGEKIWLPW